MQDQTTPTSLPQTTDDIASRGIQPTVEEMPYHTPPASAEQVVTVAQNITQAGPIVPNSEPEQTDQQPKHETNMKLVMTAAVAVLCVCAIAALSMSHKL
jgi:hypothetical protein